MTQLTVVGLGVREFDQLTLQGLAALKNADQVLFLSTTPERTQQKLREHEIQNCENLRPLYRDGAIDIENYKALLKRIVSACKKNSRVCVLLPGHPRIGVTLVCWLEKLKETLAIELSVIEGISSFCAMINDLAIDPLEHGVSLLDANRILQRNQPIDPGIDCFIYHVCSIGVSPTHLSDASRDNRLDLLQRKLQQHYPESHTVTLISSGRGDGETTSLSTSTVGNLQSLLPEIHFGTTLYIPARNRHEHPTF